MPTNPIKVAYQRLWLCLESKEDFLALFPSGTPHQVRYDSDLEYEPDPNLEECAPADFPMCRIVFRRADPNLHQSNCSSVLYVHFRIEVATGEQKQEDLWDAIFAIFRGYAMFVTTMNGATDYGGKIVHLQDLPMETSDKERDLSRGTKQWIGVAECVAWIVFDTATLAST